MTRRFTPEGAMSQALAKQRAEQKAASIDADAVESLALLMTRHPKDQEKALRSMIRKASERLSVVVGALDASVCLARLSGQIAPAPCQNAAKEAAEALFSIKNKRRGA